MKGYYIEVKNNLLDPKHIKKMGAKIWEFMWFLDKITKITESGKGIVLGGRPIKILEIAKEIGKSKSTISENITNLEKEGYLATRRVPYGMVVTVNKASKLFGRQERIRVFRTENSGFPNSNIRQYNNNTKRVPLPKGNGPSNDKNMPIRKKGEEEFYEEPAIDSETGEKITEKELKKGDSVSKIMTELIVWAEERRRCKFPNRGKQLKALAVMRQAMITPREVKERWMELEKDDYHIENGMDFMSVSSSFNRKPPQR